MIKALVLDFSRVLLHPKDNKYKGTLNGLYRSLIEKEYYDFFEYFTLNQELLDFLRTRKNKYAISILTSDIIQNAPEIQVELNRVFDNIYSAKDLGFLKKDPEIYKLIAKKLQEFPHR